MTRRFLHLQNPNRPEGRVLCGARTPQSPPVDGLPYCNRCVTTAMKRGFISAVRYTPTTPTAEERINGLNLTLHSVTVTPLDP